MRDDRGLSRFFRGKQCAAILIVSNDVERLICGTAMNRGRKTELTIRTAFGVALALLIVIGFASYYSVSRLTESSSQWYHTPRDHVDDRPDGAGKHHGTRRHNAAS